MSGTEVVVEDDGGPVKLSELDFTDLYLSEDGKYASIRGLIDSDEPVLSINMDEILDLTTFFKKVVLAGQIDDSFPLDYDGVRYRVSKIDEDGEVRWYAIRRSMDRIPRLSKLLVGTNPAIVQRLGIIGKRPSRGLILVAGATGAGKTTTVSSILQEYLINYGDIAVTIEDPPELKLSGSYRNGGGRCFQVKVKNGDFATPMRNALRHQPRFILLGEIRDPQGASQALRAAVSGHVVLATIHGGTIEESIQSIMKYVASDLDMDLARSLLADGLAAVLHQDLRRYKSGERVERRVQLKTLFFDDKMQGARSKIREGRVTQLNDDIDAQYRQMINPKISA